jgi:zinc finger CCCH domain-containing protein 13
MLVHSSFPSVPLLRTLTTSSAELPPRASFRSTLTQPSQMGNFKHQSIRSSEREKDKDADRDRERDLRDKEGQERLRSVSP